MSCGRVIWCTEWSWCVVLTCSGSCGVVWGGVGSRWVVASGVWVVIIKSCAGVGWVTIRSGGRCVLVVVDRGDLRWVVLGGVGDRGGSCWVVGESWLVAGVWGGPGGSWQGLLLVQGDTGWWWEADSDRGGSCRVEMGCVGSFPGTGWLWIGAKCVRWLWWGVVTYNGTLLVGRCGSWRNVGWSWPVVGGNRWSWRVKKHKRIHRRYG